ncbi:outer membrane beta-barrel protein [Marinilongibacter aquaticus]|uniref:outer membrane beta-barrel protein n=1 Tax=Marinilongibacter aquaticus TaxID=2975157 RepID=UPI0021BD21F5|nr:outer membrane beta-barrel protein [Marinilongibacter aquaticus]UBM59962.1 outer membrane beta-barrel protein [Marinilongibacter aquaticus]
MRGILTLSLCLLSLVLQAQSTLKGQVVDADDQSPLIAATVKLVQGEQVHAALSDEKGNFSIPDLQPGMYFLQISSVAYSPYRKRVQMKDETVDLGKIALKVESIVTDEVNVKAKQVRVEVKGDTTQFNADAYKVNVDATAEDLVKKMPGIQIEGGQVKAQGESVKKVLIDGKEFFGDDPSMALKNLPAEIISKIEVFDRKSDQSQFSGFDDGNTDKTINIVTRSGKSNGEFGKVYAGYGTDDRYSAGANMNYFNGDSRLSLIGMSNNINQQNFATDDLLGALGSSGGGGRRGRGGRGGFGGGGANPSDFLVNGQGGINKTHAIGVNYIDKWFDKVSFSGSYFFNESNNQTLDSLERTTFIDEGTNQYYTENGNQFSRNLNHRLSGRITYDINKTNSIIFSPNVSFQTFHSSNLFAGETLDDFGDLVNTISSDQLSNMKGFRFGGDLLFRHRFEKRGRTFSVGVGKNDNVSNSEGELHSENVYFGSDQSNQIINQVSGDSTRSAAYTARIDYTEPLSEHSQLRFSYQGRFNDNNATKRTYDFNPDTGEYQSVNNTLSNSFLNQYDTHTEGLSYRYFKGRDFMFIFNLNFQQAILKSEQTFPITGDFRRSFNNVLPFAMIRYAFSKTKNIRLFYRSSTNAPSISQLQNVVNNSNPLQLKAGNPDLTQETSHNLSLRFNSTNPEKATSLYAYVTGGLTNNNISNAIYTAKKDTLFRGVLLAKGSQLTLPVNYGKAWQMSSFLTYGFPLALIKSNLNFNLGMNYSTSPSLSNDQENVSKNLGINSGLVIGSNISQYFDFTLSYNGAYNIINYSLNPTMNSNYYTQTVNGTIKWTSKSGFFIQTEGVNILYKGLGEGFDRNFTLLNGSIGKKFLKKQQAELKITSFDLLNQNTSLARNATNSYVEDSRSLVLNRYFLLTFTYNIKNFRGK